MADVAHFVDAKKEIGSMGLIRCAKDMRTEFEDGLRYIFRISTDTKSHKSHMSLKRPRFLKSQRVSDFYMNLSYQNPY